MIKLYQSREWLYQKYIIERLSIYLIAKLCNCSSTNIWYWLKKYNIPIRSKSESGIIYHSLKNTDAKYKNREWLEKRYIEEKLSTTEIGEICGVTRAIPRRWLIKYNISRRFCYESKRINKKEFENKDWLYQKYIIERLTMDKIAKLLGVSRTLISKYLKKYNIPSRSRLEAYKNLSEETKEKLRETLKKCPNGMLGKHHSEEAKEKLRVAHLKENLSDETLKKMSIAQLGRPSPRKGKHHTEETKQKIREKAIGRKVSEKTKKKMSEAVKGKNNYFYGKHYCGKDNYNYGKHQTEELKKKLRERQIKFFQNPQNRKIWSEREKKKCQNLKYVKGLIKKLEMGNNLRPTKPEKIFDELTPDNVRYVGNGKWWRNHHNPDFKITGQNKVIEIYGDYWHRNDDPKDRIKEYKEMGLDCLVFWEYEVYEDTERVLKEVIDFIRIEKPFQLALKI